MKKQLGQFFTTNSDFIFQGLEKFIKNKEVCDPFAGKKDLFLWANKNGCQKINGFDYDKKYIDGKDVLFNDSINHPNKYKFVLTNPPYLHKNKADLKTKKLFFMNDKNNFEDLYQISINSILNCEEGILIVPLNFLCAENSKKIRNLFFNKFEIIKLNIFHNSVFQDTTYNVISFCFKKRNNKNKINKVDATIFPEKRNLSFILKESSGWQLGGDFVKSVKNNKNFLKIFRLTEDIISFGGNHRVEMAIQNIKDKRTFYVERELRDMIKKNILFLRAIDSKNGKKIQLEDIRKYKVDALLGKSSSRNMAHLIFGEEISIEEQLSLMKMFNDKLDEYRRKYSSLFLTNFRDNNRKRISFHFAYKFLNHLYHEKN